MAYCALKHTGQEKSCCTMIVFYFHIFFSNKDNILNRSFDYFLNSWKLVRYSHGYKNSHTFICICSYTYINVDIGIFYVYILRYSLIIINYSYKLKFKIKY